MSQLTTEAPSAPEIITNEVMPVAQQAQHYTASGAASPYPLIYDSCAKVYPSTARRIIVYVDAGGGPAECIGYPPDRGRYLIHGITRTGGAASASRALLLDYEWTLDSMRPGAAREWAETRAAHDERFITYCPRALLHKLLAELGPALWEHDGHRLMIPTLDGKQWTPLELTANISRWGVYVAPGRIWANQFASSGPRGTGELEWDESSLYLNW